jgi:23S rRNA (cytidine1920-2'-O)/16S rRNA (cytidine1409-2'-O)-methyltransferase
MAPSRERAADLIAAGRVRVAGQTATKSATQVTSDAPIVLVTRDDDHGYASRGAHKLAGALRVFAARDPALPVAGRRCLDAGASTGGFTDVLLRSGAAAVIAVDVGYGQLAWRLRTDPRVMVVERTNIRYLRPGDLGPPVELVVGDLSFISLRLVLPALRGLATEDADFVLLVKPQFEVGRDALGRGGVVRDPAARADAVRAVAAGAAELSLGVRGVVASPLPGPAGNIEFLVWFSAAAGPLDELELAAAVNTPPPEAGSGPDDSALDSLDALDTLDDTTGERE